MRALAQPHILFDKVDVYFINCSCKSHVFPVRCENLKEKVCCEDE